MWQFRNICRSNIEVNIRYYRKCIISAFPFCGMAGYWSFVSARKLKIPKDCYFFPFRLKLKQRNCSAILYAQSCLIILWGVFWFNDHKREIFNKEYFQLYVASGMYRLSEYEHELLRCSQRVTSPYWSAIWEGPHGKCLYWLY